MKDLAWWAVFVLAMVGAEIAEDYRIERCADHGGTWVKTPGCSSDYCDRSKRVAK